MSQNISFFLFTAIVSNTVLPALVRFLSSLMKFKPSKLVTSLSSDIFRE